MKKLLIWVIATASLWACDDKEQLTPQPKPYINKSSCKINGKYWEVTPKALYRPIQYNTLIVDYFIQQGDTSLNIWAESIQYGDGILLDFPLNFSKKVVHNRRKNPYYGNDELSRTCGIFYIDSTKTNIVNLIEINSKPRNVKGSFQFEALGKNCKDTIKVTDGFFDLVY
jgi:hypothetical protein